MKKNVFLIVVTCSLLGCQSPSTAPNAPAKPLPAASPMATVVVKANDEHEHSAPHGGTLVELGEEFAHLEIVLDAATGKLTVFALDGEAEKAVRLKQPEIEITIANPATVVKLSGVANSLTGETASDTSEFAGQSDALKSAARFEGVIRAVTIKGQSFKGVTFNFPKGNEK